MFNVYWLHDWIKNKYSRTCIEREVEYATFPSNALLNKVSEGIVSGRFKDGDVKGDMVKIFSICILVVHNIFKKNFHVLYKLHFALQLLLKTNCEASFGQKLNLLTCSSAKYFAQDET